jgi:hypothetical protein
MRRQVGADQNVTAAQHHRIVVVLCLRRRWEDQDCVDLITGTVGEISTDS